MQLYVTVLTFQHSLHLVNWSTGQVAQGVHWLPPCSNPGDRHTGGRWYPDLFIWVDTTAWSWNRFGDTGNLPAGDQIWNALERDPGWPSRLAFLWSTTVQWPPWWLDSHDDTFGRDSSIKGKGLLVVVVVSCWIYSCELQSMLLGRYWKWRAMSFATRLLVAAPTETVARANPNILQQLYQWPECPTRSSLTGSKERPPTASAVVYITVPMCGHRFMTLVTKELYLHIHWIKPRGHSLSGKNVYWALSIIVLPDQMIPKPI